MNWTPLYRANTWEDKFNLFHSQITTAINSCLPLRSIKLHPTDKPWMTADIKDVIKKRQRAWSKGNILQYNIQYNMHYTIQYNMFRNKVSRLCKNARSSFYNNSIANMQEPNPKKWWDNIKLLSGLSKTPSLTKIHVDGAELKDGELAEALNDRFTNVTSDIEQLDFIPVDTNHSSDEYAISPESVEKALSSSKERKSNGPDDIPNWVLKNFARSHKPLMP